MSSGSRVTPACNLCSACVRSSNELYTYAGRGGSYAVERIVVHACLSATQRIVVNDPPRIDPFILGRYGTSCAFVLVVDPCSQEGLGGYVFHRHALSIGLAILLGQSPVGHVVLCTALSTPRICSGYWLNVLALGGMCRACTRTQTACLQGSDRPAVCTSLSQLQHIMRHSRLASKVQPATERHEP